MSFAGLTLEDFTPHIGTDFVLPGGDTTPPVHFRLTTVTPKNKAPMPEMRDPFLLIFLVDAQDVYAQNTFRLIHPEMGELDIFLVPASKSADGVEYCATFS